MNLFTWEIDYLYIYNKREREREKKRKKKRNAILSLMSNIFLLFYHVKCAYDWSYNVFDKFYSSLIMIWILTSVILLLLFSGIIFRYIYIYFNILFGGIGINISKKN